jgi:soluble lytic murein transglycosylase-like protein
LAVPEPSDAEAVKRADDTAQAAARLLGPELTSSLIKGDNGAPDKRVWTAPRWSEAMPKEERNLVLHGLRSLWGEKLTVDPEPKALEQGAARPAPRTAAREERAEDFAAVGDAQATLAARFGGLPDQGVAFDNAAERVTDAVAAPPAANLPAFPARPEPEHPVTGDGQTASPAPAVPPAPVAAPRPAVGEGKKDACSPLKGKGSKPNSSLEEIVAEESHCTGVSPDVIKALIAAKGGNRRNPLVVTGPAADWVGVRGNLNDPRTSIRAGALLLSKLYTFFKGDLNRALAAYELGTTAVIRSGGIPNNKAVKDLLAEFQRAYRKDGDKPAEPVTPPESPNLRRAEEEVKNVLVGPQLAPRVSFSATAPYRKAILEAARMYGVDPALIEAVMLSESNGNPRTVSSAGAQGLMQLMPGTARALGVKDSFNTTQNINGGTRYLKELLTRFNGNAVLAVAAYNAGPNRASLAAGRVPTIVETVYYTTRVFHRYAQLTGTEMTDLSGRLTAKGKRLYQRESRRLEKLWGPTAEDLKVPVPTPRPVAR